MRNWKNSSGRPRSKMLMKSRLFLVLFFLSTLVAFEIRLVMDAVLPYKFIYAIKNRHL